MEETILPMTTKIMLTIISLALISLVIRACDALILKPRRLRSQLRKQGIGGPPPALLVGNILQMNKARSQVPKQPQGGGGVVHNCVSFLFPALEQWAKQYGPTFMFSLGNIQFLHMNDPDVVKEISICTSLEFGKPSCEHKLLGPLLGQGIISSNGSLWAHQRKIIGPMLTMDSVKAMMRLMVEPAKTLVSRWTSQIESEGGVVADIKVDEHMIGFSTEVISRACFGSNYSEAEEIFLNIRHLQENMIERSPYLGIPIFRYIPTKSNRETRRLEKKIRALVLKVAQARKQATTQNEDIFQTIVDGSEKKSALGLDSGDRFIVDNFKNIYLAGYETAAVSAAWTLMLLATNPEWQDVARAEVLEVCGGQDPDPDMVRKMKVLTMVIYESLRLYPPVPQLVREAFQDLHFGDVEVPKGVSTWTIVASLHQDPKIWGPDAHVFNPERFANGVSGSCNQPHVYMPFGAGPRVCLGQHFAMAELKILLAFILSNFAFTLSPNYRHSPVQKLVLMPQFGVHLLVRKL